MSLPSTTRRAREIMKEQVASGQSQTPETARYVANLQRHRLRAVFTNMSLTETNDWIDRKYAERQEQEPAYRPA